MCLPKTKQIQKVNGASEIVCKSEFVLAQFMEGTRSLAEVQKMEMTVNSARILTILDTVMLN